jgi:hypothetical protein
MSTPRRFTGAVAASVAAASITVAIAAAAGNGSAVESPSTLMLSTPFEGGKTRTVDLGKKGLGAGDMFLSTGAPVRDEATGRRIGALDGIETILSPAHDGTVSELITMRLEDGTLVLQNVIRHTDRPAALAVTGGTGAYADARGQMTEVDENEQRKVTIFKLELMR